MLDPQDAPDFWTIERRRMIDIDGVEIVLVWDQDGREYVVDAEDWNGGLR